MRRISLALALLSAAAAGCGGGSTPDNSGGARGVAEGTFTITIQNGQDGNAALAIKGGTVVSNPAGINCGVGQPLAGCTATFPSKRSDGTLNVVTLTANATSATVPFLEWAGDCQGDVACTVTGLADRYVVVRFGNIMAEGHHPNWNPDPAPGATQVHADKYRAFAVQCNACHGLNWNGLAIAPSCFTCHNLDKRESGQVSVSATDGHFAAASPAFDDHDLSGGVRDDAGWSRACLRCHTNQGFQDYVGALDNKPNNLLGVCTTAADGTVTCDGSFNTDETRSATTQICEGVINADGTLRDPPGSNTCDTRYEYGPLTCKTCHNSATDPVKAGLTRIRFVSGKVVNTDRVTGLCGQCHQGRESTVSVNAKIPAGTLPDAVIGTSTFLNPHYAGAAGTIFGADAQMWAQYPGKSYTGQNSHAGNGSCTSCHQHHTVESPVAVSATTCGKCHKNADGTAVTTLAQLEAAPFTYGGDFDGDGTVEAVKVEIEGLEHSLEVLLAQYATSEAAPICYNGASHPYFYQDAAPAGFICGAEDTVRYNTFTPRSLRGAFNYKWAHAETGAWAHNPRYVIEILVDAVEDLRAGIVANGGTPSEPAGSRVFVGLGGHFDPASEAFRHWDADAEVSASCAKCHGGEAGYKSYVADGIADPVPQAASMACGTCHAGGTTATAMLNLRTTLPANQLKFVSGKVVTTDAATHLCGECHGGRESTTSVNAALQLSTGPDVQLAAAGVSFRNPHYLGAAATLFGADAAGWAQYPNKVYTGANTHAVNEGSCISCHDPHTGDVAVSATTCGRCHFDETTGLAITTFAQLEEQRQFGFEGDIDGDAVVESLKLEIEGLEATLYAAMRAYATGVVGTNIAYGDSHPYFFVDTDNDGVVDAGETTQFKKFTPRLMRAAFNYKWAHAEPGAWAHNPRYAIEVLFDAITDLNEGLVANGRTAVAFAGFRTFRGHFGGAETLNSGGMPFADWDPGPVPNNCSQCHAGKTGIENYLADQNTALTSPSVTGMQCTTCHAPAATDTTFDRMRTIAAVNFPPRKAAAKQFVAVAADFSDANDMVCATCHTGRENMTSVADKNDGKLADSWTVGFTNPHYLGAAGVLFGADAGMLYHVSGAAGAYAGKATQHSGSCVACHSPQGSRHTFEVNMTGCATCHDGVAQRDLGVLAANINTLADALYATIVTYSQQSNVVDNGDGTFSYPNAVCYDGAAYPYWFKDDGKDGGTAANGICDGRESADRAYGAKFNPAGAIAAFNYKWSQAEPGAFAHNYAYMNQILCDSITSLGGTAPVERVP